MPQKHPTDKSQVLTKIASQKLTINPATAIDRDLTLNWYGEGIENNQYERKDVNTGWLKTYRNGEFYVKDETRNAGEGIYASPASSFDKLLENERTDVLELLKEREIELEWADFKASMKTANVDVGTLDDARYVLGSSYFQKEVLYRENNEWFTLSKDGTITHVPEEELHLWFLGYRGNMSLVSVEKVRKLKPHEYPVEEEEEDEPDLEEDPGGPDMSEERVIEEPVRYSESGAAES